MEARTYDDQIADLKKSSFYRPDLPLISREEWEDDRRQERIFLRFVLDGLARGDNLKPDVRERMEERREEALTRDIEAAR